MSDYGPRVPDPRMIPSWHPAGGRHGRHGDPGPDGDSPQTDDPLIRPFLITGGRTAPSRRDLRVETLVQADAGALLAPLQFEPRTVVRLCQAPHSVAEVAVRLAVPLGVARVLISDLIGGGHLRVIRQRDIAIDLLERIRDRVRAL